MKSDKIFYYTRSERNIPYSYYTARKYLYLFISGPFLNILTNLQSKIGRLTADSVSITEDVVTQFARDLDFRIRRVGKEIRNALLNRIENLFSLEDILHFLLHTVRKGVELFAETVNLFLQYLLIIASLDNRMRRII
jgi:hypothetical protein